MNLKEKLRIIHKSKRSPSTEAPALRDSLDSLFRHRKSRRSRDIENVVEGETVKTEYGEVFVSETVTDILYKEKIDELTSAFQATLSGKADRITHELHKTLFLDLETTGLSGGAGNYAFLIGIGLFSEGRFTVKQFFLKEFVFERAMLFLVENLLAPFSHFVSYNGKSYDIPFLINRYVLCGLSTTIPEKSHTDLLYPSRVLWKGLLDSLKFSSIERFIFKKERTCDIPGALIPSAYFEYQREGVLRNMKEIFHHNLDDIIGLFLLYHELSLRFSMPWKYKGIRLPLAKHLFDRFPDRAATLLKSILNDSTDRKETYDAMNLLSIYHKRRNGYTQALSLWKSMIELAPAESTAPFIELAKYYEHKRKDYNAALAMLDRLLAASHKTDDNIAHRRNRIRGKISKKSK